MKSNLYVCVCKYVCMYVYSQQSPGTTRWPQPGFPPNHLFEWPEPIILPLIQGIPPIQWGQGLFTRTNTLYVPSMPINHGLIEGRKEEGVELGFRFNFGFRDGEYNFLTLEQVGVC